MIIVKLCFVALITGVCAIILKVHKSELVPLCLTAGGIILAVFTFDYLYESLNFLREFTAQSKIDSSVIRTIFKVIGVGYLIELTAGSIKDLGFEGLSDKLIACGKLVIFVLAIPIIKSLFEVVVALIKLV